MRAPHIHTDGTTALITPITVEQMVEAAQTARDKMNEARKLCAEAKKIMQDTFGERSAYRFQVTNEEDVENEIKGDAWKSILNKIDFWKMASVSLADKYQKMIYDTPQDLPSLTFESVMDAFETLRQNRTEYVIEAVQEVYDWLCPRNPANEKLKTNQKGYVGKKAIKKIYNVYDARYLSMNLESYARIRLTALDKILHFLDNNQPFDSISYNCPLVDAIEKAMTNIFEERKVSGTSPYVDFTIYMNGNAHLVFKNDEVMARMNKIVGENILSKKTKTKETK